MQQAVLHHFPDVQATYRFTHRDKDVPFTRECIDTYRAAVSRTLYLSPECVLCRSCIEFSMLAITQDELKWLKEMCPYFKPTYLEYLSTFKFKTEQVSIQFVPITEDGEHGHVEIEASGPWLDTIMWEVPLMACLSELYFRMVDTDWIGDGQYGTCQISAASVLFLTSPLRKCFGKGEIASGCRLHFQ